MTLITNQDKIQQGQTDYDLRLRPVITLTSPAGDAFEGVWVSGDKSIKKKLSIFNFANVQGSLVKDLGIDSWSIPLVFYLTGNDHDLDARRFGRALSQRGQWGVVHPVDGVVHPVDGFLSLQISDASIKYDPVKSGGVTLVTLTCIEPLNQEFSPTDAMLANAVRSRNADLQDAAAGNWVDKLRTKTEALRSAIKSTVGRVTAAVDKALGPISELSDTLRSTFLDIQNSIQDLMASTILEPIQIAASLQQLTQLPALGTRDIAARLRAYNALASDLISNFVPDITQSDIAIDDRMYNDTLISELMLAATYGALAMSTATGDLQTRAKALGYLDNVGSLMSDMTNTLDGVQSVFVDRRFIDRYFSQSQSFSQAALLTADTFKYLLEKSFSLRIEKRFVLANDAPSIAVCMKEYKGLGVGEENYTEFIDANNLTPDEILNIPAGRELVVYV